MNGLWAKSSPKLPRTRARGFTLVEIAVAIAVLGIALTTLLTLNTQQLNSALQERNLTKAALYGKYLLTLVEVESDAPVIGTKDGEILDVVRENLGPEGLLDEDLRIALDGWKYEQNVSSVDLPELVDAMRRIDLTVSWGDTESESFSLVYYKRPKNQ